MNIKYYIQIVYTNSWPGNDIIFSASISDDSISSKPRSENYIEIKFDPLPVNKDEFDIPVITQDTNHECKNLELTDDPINTIVHIIEFSVDKNNILKILKKLATNSK